MKKIFTVFMASILMLVSCSKAPMSKVIFKNSTTIDDVSYSMLIERNEEGYSWSIVNSTKEVTTNYTYTYDTKKYICQDFANITNELKNSEDVALGVLLPTFGYVFNFIDNKDNEAIITQTVKGGIVLVNFIFTGKSFSIPYTFIINANDILNPKQEKQE